MRLLTWFKWSEEVVPTVGFNVRNVRKGNITLKIWDIAGASLLHVCPYLPSWTRLHHRPTKIPLNLGTVL